MQEARREAVNMMKAGAHFREFDAAAVFSFSELFAKFRGGVVRTCSLLVSTVPGLYVFREAGLRYPVVRQPISVHERAHRLADELLDRVSTLRARLELWLIETLQQFKRVRALVSPFPRVGVLINRH